MERMLSRPRFNGPVDPGRRYVLVDDVSTMGGTLAELADHIRRNGGEVVGAITLVNASREGHFAARRMQTREIERRYGDDVRELFGIDPAGLTADEAKYILNFRDADALRNRAASAVRDRSIRLRQEGFRASADGQRSNAVTPDPISAIESDLSARLEKLGLSDCLGGALIRQLSRAAGRSLREIARETRVTVSQIRTILARPVDRPHPQTTRDEASVRRIREIEHAIAGGKALDAARLRKQAAMEKVARTPRPKRPK